MGDQGWDEQHTAGRDRSISRRIVRRVSAVEGTGADEFDERLYDAIDPDAIDQIFEDAPPETRLEFPFRGYLVIVHGEGTIEVTSQ